MLLHALAYLKCIEGHLAHLLAACHSMPLRRTKPHDTFTRAQVEEVAVSGPRYWAQGVRGPRALAALYGSGVLAVQRKAGALSYAHDPTGVRSLLSHAFDKVGTPLGNPRPHGPTAGMRVPPPACAACCPMPLTR